MKLQRSWFPCWGCCAGAILTLCVSLAWPADLPREHGAIVRGSTEQKKLAVVFTGHEFAESGDIILRELKRHDAKGSFFLTGEFLANARFNDLVHAMVRAGHYVGPHSDKHLLYCSWDFSRKTLVTHDQFRADLQNNMEKLQALQPRAQSTRYFLPPYEHCNEEIAQWTHELGLTLINYTPGTRSTADYTTEADTNFVSTAAIFDSIVAREQRNADGLNGFILLLHIGAGPNRADKFHGRFGELLDFLSSKGHQLVRVDELLDPKPEAYIRVNQLGYRPGEPKLAMAFSQSPLPESFSLVRCDEIVNFGSPANETRHNPVFTGRTLDVSPGWGQFQHHAELDFSSFKKPGRYCLRVGDTESLPFRISPDVLVELSDELLDFMREQRCGTNPWLGALCHQLDGRTAYGPLPSGTALDARGGWHDAADLLKYQLTSGNATAQMLLAHLLRSGPGVDLVDALGAPVPNGVPDLLDEARWGLDWLLKLHPAPDQLYHQVADDRDHIGFRLPQNEVADYGWGKGGARVVYFADGRPQGLARYKSESTGVANLAGRYAAAMSLAYQVWKDDPAQRPFAERCLQAGIEVYRLGRAAEGVQQGNSYGAPYRYEESTWADDMEWGAAELYRATHQRGYLDDAKVYAVKAASESWMGREQTAHYQFYPFMNLGHFRLHELVEPKFKRMLEQYYREGIERCVRAGNGNPFRVGVPFIWCSNNLLVALATQCSLYERMSGDARYREFAARQRDWLLGRNPWGYSMFTCVGSVSPHDTHMQTLRLLHRPVRGGLVDGPVYERIFKSLKGVTITEPDPLALFQGQAVYHDDFQDYSSNEPTMDGTASAILLWAVCK